MPGIAASKTWNCGTSGPQTVDDLRVALRALAKKKSGSKLISSKFKKDHLFCGHEGSPLRLSRLLSRYRSVNFSTLLVSNMELKAQEEVLNWIDKVPASKLTYSNGRWTVDTSGTAVKGKNAYKWATVDKEALAGMNPDDIVKKARNWLTMTKKVPAIACQFDTKDGTPVIYHLDY